MKKALVTIAVGDKYLNLYNRVAPTFQFYAKKHGWDLHVIDTIPESFAAQYSRKERPEKAYICWLYKLLLPTLFEDYDLCLFVDADCIINPASPCISSIAEEIPECGFAAAPDVVYKDRARYFPDFRKYHYDDYIAEGVLERQVAQPELHINAGVLLFKPAEVLDRWLELLNMDSWMKEEDRLNVFEVQSGKVLMLPKEWHCAYLYERVRRGLPYRVVSGNGIASRIINSGYRKILEPLEKRMLPDILESNHIIHFLLEHEKIGLVDTNKLLSMNEK